MSVAAGGGRGRSRAAAPAPSRRAIEAAVLELLQARDAASSACPSEVARALDARAWRRLMPAVRAAAAHLAERGAIVVLQRGQVVDIGAARGPVRLRLAARARRTARRAVSSGSG
ncbi:MAG: DUF3253 domain-containing protein [Polyangiaceae bacterium]